MQITVLQPQFGIINAVAEKVQFKQVWNNFMVHRVLSEKAPWILSAFATLLALEYKTWTGDS